MTKCLKLHISRITYDEKGQKLKHGKHNKKFNHMVYNMLGGDIIDGLAYSLAQQMATQEDNLILEKMKKEQKNGLGHDNN